MIAGCWSVRPRRLVTNLVRRSARGRVRHPDPAQKAPPPISLRICSPSAPTPMSRVAPTPGSWPTPTVELIVDGPRGGEVFAMRQISLRDPARSRQMHILTTRRDMSAAEVRYRMGSRWRQENPPLRPHPLLIWTPTTATAPATTTVTGWCPTGQEARPPRRRERPPSAQDSQSASNAALTGRALTSTRHHHRRVDQHDDQHHQHRRPHRRERLEAALAAHAAIPARLPLAEVNRGQQVLDTETKLIHHAIRIAAHNTAQYPDTGDHPDTGYRRADEEAHTLIRTVLVAPATSSPTLHQHRARSASDPLPTPRQTAAITELCQAPQRHQHRLPRH